LRIGVSDPGSVNLGGRFAYVNAGSDIDFHLGLCAQFGLVPTLAIFEPGFLRAALSYWRAGRLPDGTMLRFYFGGSAPERDGGFWFGLPPTRTSLDAYLAMLDGCPLPWSVAVLGGDLFASELPEVTLERGGHLRVGLEDYAGDPVTNEELVTHAVAIVEKAGRRVASCAETAEMLGLKGMNQ
jgi:3-keto-5-aminohexanoate cleavage enzyme